MDLNGAEKSVQKLLIYLQSVADSDSRLYDKSKQKLKGISDMCVEVVKTVSDILQTEMLKDNDIQEFENSPDKELQSQVKILSDEVDKIKTFVQVDNTPTTNIETLSWTDENNNMKMTTSEMRKVVSTYRTCLYQLARFNSNIKVVNDCFSIIWKWFEARILTKHENAPPFHYNVYRFKGIIYATVILLGYYIEHNDYDGFFDMFNNWIHTLNLSESSNKWIAPYQIYQLERELTYEYANLTSVVIWDLLLDNGLMQLCNLESKYDVYLHKNKLWDMIEQLNPNILDNYINYKDDPTILSKLNIL
jgi:hypothetical protein